MVATTVFNRHKAVLSVVSDSVVSIVRVVMLDFLLLLVSLVCGSEVLTGGSLLAFVAHTCLSLMVSQMIGVCNHPQYTQVDDF